MLAKNDQHLTALKYEWKDIKVHINLKVTVNLHQANKCFLKQNNFKSPFEGCRQKVKLKVFEIQETSTACISEKPKIIHYRSENCKLSRQTSTLITNMCFKLVNYFLSYMTHIHVVLSIFVSDTIKVWSTLTERCLWEYFHVKLLQSAFSHSADFSFRSKWFFKDINNLQYIMKQYKIKDKEVKKTLQGRQSKLYWSKCT